MNRHHAAAGAAGILLLALAGCSSPADPPASDPPAPMPTTAPTTTAPTATAPTTTAPTATAAATGGLGVAVTSTCEYGSDPQCLDVAGQYVLVDPAAFRRAGVASVEVTGSDDSQADDGQAVSVRFDEEGAALFREATAEAADAGGDARLLLRAGDVVVSAVTVLQEIEGDTVQILPGDEDAQDLADRILAG